LAGADAALLYITELKTGTAVLRKASQVAPDIPWGGWLQDRVAGELKPLREAGCDFVVFPADAPLAMLENEEVGKILAVEATLGEGLLRALNTVPVDGVLITGKDSDSLTWQHLLLCQRCSDLLSKPLLVLLPSRVTGNELRALWEAGVDGVLLEVPATQLQERIRELRQKIDEQTFSLPRRRQRVEPLLPRIGLAPAIPATEEEEEE